jgi:EAL domain-containing protein (putative c-di-GMP-specific phosphodiesterase class I)
VYLDDFGTGYSSLSSLHRLPIDALKVDRSFTAAHRRAGRAQMVRTVATLARNLDLAVVAEGVETEEQLAAVRAWGASTRRASSSPPRWSPTSCTRCWSPDPRW